MKQVITSVTFRCNFVWPWGLAFSELAELLSGELPQMRNARIDFALGDFSTPEAIAHGEADFGFVTPPACGTMAYRGVGPYTKKMASLRSIASLPHDDRMMWAVPPDSGIRSIRDMKDHPARLVVPEKVFPVRFAVEKILQAYGTSIEELKERGWQIIEESHCLKIPTLVLQGKADALVHEGRNTPAWLELGRTRRMRYLAIDEPVLQALENRYGYKKAVLPKGMFSGIDTDIPCIDFSDWLLFTREDMEEDLVYLMTKMIVEKKEMLFEFHFRGIPTEISNLTCPIDPARLWRNVGGIPLHRGAERYYRERGYMV
jgi:uncharacterized protein